LNDYTIFFAETVHLILAKIPNNPPTSSSGSTKSKLAKWVDPRVLFGGLLDLELPKVILSAETLMRGSLGQQSSGIAPEDEMEEAMEAQLDCIEIVDSEEEEIEFSELIVGFCARD
jgi:hypothetical protein